MKTHEETLAELKEMNNAPVDYTDIPPMTEEERKTAQPYYMDFLGKLPPDMVKELARQRLTGAGTTSQEMTRK